MSNTLVHRLLAALLVLGLAACTSLHAPVRMYEGAVRPATEVAHLSVPEVVEVMAVDGRDVPGGLLGQRALTLDLLPGEHVLTLRYVELFESTHGDDHEVVRSHPAALRFTAQAGSHYEFRFSHPKDVDAAHAFAKAPAFELLEPVSGAVTPSVQVKSFADASLLDTIGQAFRGDDKAAGGKPATATNVDLLKDVWGRSSPEERKAFRAWLDQGDKP